MSENKLPDYNAMTHLSPAELEREHEAAHASVEGSVLSFSESSVRCEIRTPQQNVTVALPRILFPDQLRIGWPFALDMVEEAGIRRPRILPRDLRADRNPSREAAIAVFEALHIGHLPGQQEDEHVSEAPRNSCGQPARQGQFGPLDDARLQLAAKDAEIAELRQRVAIFQRGEALALGQMGTATIERDEARECVRRLYAALQPFANTVPIEPTGLITGLMREDFATAVSALAATPEHLR